MGAFEDAGWFCVDNLPPGPAAGAGRPLPAGGVARRARGGRVRRAGRGVVQGPRARARARRGGRRRPPAGGLPRGLRRDAHRPLPRDPPRPTRCRPAGPSARASSASEPSSRTCASGPTWSSTPRACRSGTCAGGSPTRCWRPRGARGCTCSSCRSATSTGSRVTPISSWTCASSRTPTTSRPSSRYTGLDPQVAEFVRASPGLDEFMSRFEALLDFLLPAYAEEGKTSLVIGIGCTGGRHRSVTVAEMLARRYAPDFDVSVSHRHIGRASPRRTSRSRRHERGRRRRCPASRPWAGARGWRRSCAASRPRRSTSRRS